MYHMIHVKMNFSRGQFSHAYSAIPFIFLVLTMHLQIPGFFLYQTILALILNLPRRFVWLAHSKNACQSAGKAVAVLLDS